jgi:predicted dehydrogenase
MMKLRGGIIGLGKMGLSHAAIVGPHPDAELAAVCDTSSLILDAFRKFTGVGCHTDYKKMIDSEKLDFVIVEHRRDFIIPLLNTLLRRVYIPSAKNLSALQPEKGKTW